MALIDKSLFSDWEVGFENLHGATFERGNETQRGAVRESATPTLVVSGRWLQAPQEAVTLEEHPQGGAMERSLILHLQLDPNGTLSQQVVFRKKVELDVFNVVAIRFPSGEFERIYLPNYDPHDTPEE